MCKDEIRYFVLQIILQDPSIFFNMSVLLHSSCFGNRKGIFFHFLGAILSKYLIFIFAHLLQLKSSLVIILNHNCLLTTKEMFVYILRWFSTSLDICCTFLNDMPAKASGASCNFNCLGWYSLRYGLWFSDHLQNLCHHINIIYI